MMFNWRPLHYIACRHVQKCQTEETFYMQVKFIIKVEQ
jgi:hypothetical protein